MPQWRIVSGDAAAVAFTAGDLAKHLSHHPADPLR